MRIIDYREVGSDGPGISSEPEGWMPGPDPDRTELVPGHRGGFDLVRLEAGTHVPMHSVPMLAVCVMLEGAGQLRVAGGHELAFGAGDVIVFPPGLDHEWYDIRETTIVVVVEDPEAV